MFDKVGDGTLSKEGYSASHATGFKDFKLKPEPLRAIDDCGFVHPSGVQRECIPQAISGSDIFCQAKSGTGKTVAFVLACLQQIDAAASGVQALVICQSRELACQTNLVFNRFRKHFAEVKSCVLFEGVSIANHTSCYRRMTLRSSLARLGDSWAFCEKKC